MQSVSICDSLCSGPCSSDVYAPNFGIKGSNYENSRIMFVLHRSDSRALSLAATQLAMPSFSGNNNVDAAYWNALRKSDTGRVISWLLKSYCNMSWDDVFVTNFFKCLLPKTAKGKDREPRENEYLMCADVLRKQIISAAPKKIVAFGGKTIEYMLPEITLGKDLPSLALTTHSYENIPLIVSYHPRKIHDMKIAESREHLIALKNFIKS